MNDLADIPTAQPKTKKTEIPVVPFKDTPAVIDGKSEEPVTIKDYLDLLDELALVTADVKAAGEVLQRAGIRELYARNCANPNAVTSSVMLVDASVARAGAEIDGNTQAVRVTTVDKYSVDETAVKNYLALRVERQLPPMKIEDIMQWQVNASFDATVLFDNGVFSRDRFEAFQKALNAVCEQYGVLNPLELTKSPVINPTFHTRRWKEMDATENAVFARHVKNTEQIAAVRPKAAKVQARAAGSRRSR